MDCESCNQENPSGLLGEEEEEEEAIKVGLLLRLHLNGNVRKRGFEDKCIEFSG